MRNSVYIIIAIFPLLASSQSLTQNFIETKTYKVPTSSSIQNPTDDQISSTITYYDGLGRPLQINNHKQSNNAHDIITHLEYDGFGRQAMEYLPYVGGETGKFDDASLDNTLSYYTEIPFSKKHYESSAMNRVLKQSAPGDSWEGHLTDDSDNTIKYQYNTNTDSEVLWFTAETSWYASYNVYDAILKEGTSKYYNPNTLYKNIIKDENWKPTQGNNHTTEEFINNEGQVVLKRTYNDGEVHDTYYVYDVYGNLSFVIPPKVQINDVLTDNNNQLNALCYQYKYDYRNRLVEKKIPGKKDWECIVYDKLDRVVATGPAYDPLGENSLGWLITKYDIFGRVIYTGWHNYRVDSANRLRLQQNRDGDSILFETKIDTPNSIDNVDVYYTNDHFVTDIELLSVNYYDNYNFPDGPSSEDLNLNIFSQEKLTNCKGLPTGTWQRISMQDGFVPMAETTYTLYDRKARPIRVCKKNHLGGNTITDTKLDFLGKPLYIETNHKRNPDALNLKTLESFSYTQQDRLLSVTHKINDLPEELLAYNEYDNLGKLIGKKTGGQDSSAANSYQHINYFYNIRGWLTAINDIDNLMVNGDPIDLFAFKISYDNPSNIINGIEPLYNGNISETFWRTSSDNIQRQYGYQYDDLNRLLNAVYNKPGMATMNNYNESLTYDKNGNIKSLDRFGGLDAQGDTYQIDHLNYFYGNEGKSNQLMKVVDSTNSSLGFDDDSSGIDHQDDYTYDDLGNMTSDQNKDIIEISYNHLNQPIKIKFSSGNTITYAYNTAGTKVKKEIATTTELITIDFIDGYQYKNQTLQFFPTSEGYVNYVINVDSGDQGNTGRSGWYNYVYNYLDHLGNVRMSYGFDPKTEQIKILEENHYYPFGLKHTNYNSTKNVYEKENEEIAIKPAPPYMKSTYNYKYNGKEFQDELGLNVYDYGWRNYSPDIGRWTQIDPLFNDLKFAHDNLDVDPDDEEEVYMAIINDAEVGGGIYNTDNLNPYGYGYNNPVSFDDPDGRCPSCDDDPISGLLSWTDVDDVAVAVTTVTRGVLGMYDGKPKHIDGTDASASDTGFLIAGALLPVVSGGTVKKLFNKAVNFLKKDPGLGNQFKNKTLKQVGKAMDKQVKKGKLEAKPSAPGNKAYQNKKSKYSYNVDPGKVGKKGRKEAPHVDVNYPNPKPKNVPNKKKLWIKDKKK
ncbi:type IV secretion protein Rhs [Flavobacterium sp. CYK-4]|uniref:DUF6443 domain-containing protein n=1 Tax=Flavobacterium lotistagni TaxID=2709660 RepID=UPI00140AE6C2|nr:DUF6443 domain-containing protein [Flavobacterium lotistagni]NHM05702.1 type IV secretion protein Rhs [Flavobacterium lotistagni]